VALGCQQVDEEYFIETYSSTVQADSLRLTVAKPLHQNMTGS